MRRPSPGQSYRSGDGRSNPPRPPSPSGGRAIPPRPEWNSIGGLGEGASTCRTVPVKIGGFIVSWQHQVETQVMQKLYMNEHEADVQGYGKFRFASPSARTFVEAGFSEVAAANLEYICFAQLGIHQCREAFKRDMQILGECPKGYAREKATDAQKKDALERVDDVYTYDFSTLPKIKQASKWGHLADLIKKAKAFWKENGTENPTDEQLRTVAQSFHDQMKASEEAMKKALGL